MAASREKLLTAISNELAVQPPTEEEIEAILGLAALAAHGTGDRTSAPVACFLAGIAAASTDTRADALRRAERGAAAVVGDQR